MQFEKCLTCPAIKQGKCAGPNYMAMSSHDLVEWGTEYQRLNKITNAQLAKHSGVPKGTIDGIKYRADVRHDTINLLIKALIEMTGGVWGGEPCASSGTLTDELAAKVGRLEDLIQWKDEKIEHFAQEVEILKEQLHTKDTQIREHWQVSKRSRVLITSLCVGLFACLLLIVGSLVIDKLNPGIGFIWLNK